MRLWTVEPNGVTCGPELARFEGGVPFNCLALSVDGTTLAVGDAIGCLHIFDVIPDAVTNAAWLAKFDSADEARRNVSAGDLGDRDHSGTPTASSDLPPGPLPVGISGVPPEMQVSTTQLESARHIETYRGRHLFALSDGRVYLDGLIAVGSLEHVSRITLRDVPLTTSFDGRRRK